MRRIPFAAASGGSARVVTVWLRAQGAGSVAGADQIADLLRLAVLAADAEAELFRRNPQSSGRYAGRLLGRALCQGAALHYVNQSNGVKDFDAWSFYAQYDDWPFPARWRGDSGRQARGQAVAGEVGGQERHDLGHSPVLDAEDVEPARHVSAGAIIPQVGAECELAVCRCR